jgi:hypothetical protein
VFKRSGSPEWAAERRDFNLRAVLRRWFLHCGFVLTPDRLLDGAEDETLPNFCRRFQGWHHLTDIPGARAPGYKYCALPGLKIGQIRPGQALAP